MGSSPAVTQYKKNKQRCQVVTSAGVQSHGKDYTCPCVCSHQMCVCAGKGGGRGGKTSIAGVKRGGDALFQKQWENVTEPSEAALSDASAFPATTEASARCKPSLLLSNHFSVSEPTRPHPTPSHPVPHAPELSHPTATHPDSALSTPTPPPPHSHSFPTPSYPAPAQFSL